MNRRVVVTGRGLISALGEGTAAFWESWTQGRSGIQTYSDTSVHSKPWCWGGEAKGFKVSDHISFKQKKFLKVMSRDIQLAMVASKYAVQEAGLLSPEVQRERIGISLGTSLINNELDEIGISFKASSEDGKMNLSRYGADGRGALTPLWMLKYLPNMPACHISINYDMQGPSNTITTEAASALQAIGEGAAIIQRGSADCMVVGGVDSKINPIALSKYDLLGLFPSHNYSSPEDAFQPFNDQVSGFLPGEAAAILILEEREHALKRKVPIYGEILGYATAPLYDYLPQGAHDVEGRFLALRKSLESAGLSASDLSFMIAHGSGIASHDICEKKAIKKLLEKESGGNQSLPITCLKHLTGYVGAASGAVEVIAGLLAIQNRLCPPIHHWKGQSDGLNFIQKPCLFESGAHPHKPLRALVHSTSIIGHSASMVIEAGENGSYGGI